MFKTHRCSDITRTLAACADILLHQLRNFSIGSGSAMPDPRGGEMSASTAVNDFLGHFGVRVVRTKTLSRLIHAPDRAASTPTQDASPADAAASLLHEIYNGRLDVSSALIAALKDIRVTAQIAAGQSSADWIARHADKVNAYSTRHDMLDALCNGDVPDGDLAEFGVFTGAVTRFLRPRFPTREYHAFDSFRGVPKSMGLAITGR